MDAHIKGVEGTNKRESTVIPSDQKVKCVFYTSSLLAEATEFVQTLECTLDDMQFTVKISRREPFSR